MFSSRSRASAPGLVIGTVTTLVMLAAILLGSWPVTSGVVGRPDSVSVHDAELDTGVLAIAGGCADDADLHEQSCR